ncbi:hypothetical protein ABZP36_004673 [Zizania latifolia]
MSSEMGVDQSSSDDGTTSDHDEEDLASSVHQKIIVRIVLSFSDKKVQIKARWQHEPDENDRLNASHFRDILTFSCGGESQSSSGIQFVKLTTCGVSFMWHQIPYCGGS